MEKLICKGVPVYYRNRPAEGEILVRDFGSSGYHVIDGGHLVMREQPKECAERILSFLKRLSL